MNKIFNVILFFLAATLVANSFAYERHYPRTYQYISYTEAGQGEPLILIHAFPTDKRLWAPQITGLKSNFHVFAIDLWGFGDTQITDGNTVMMSQYADEVKQFMDEHNITKAIIGGESMGGYVALAFLQKYPSKVSGLILSGTESIAATPSQKKEYEKQAISVIRNSSTQALIEEFLPKAISPLASAELRADVRTIFETQSFWSVGSALRGIAAREDTSSVLRNNNLPLLIITGDQDEVIPPQESINMHALSQNSRLLIIKNSGHLVNLEKPQEWNQAVIDMFASHRSQ